MNEHVHPLFADLFELFWPHVDADYDAALANARAAEQRAASKPSPLDDCIPSTPPGELTSLVKTPGGSFSEAQR